MNFEVNLVIDAADVKAIKQANQWINLAKPTGESTTPSAIWLSIDPFESTDISWTEDYGIYASTSPFAHGAKISSLSETPFPAQDEVYYDLKDNVFDGPLTNPERPVPAGTYAALNSVPSTPEQKGLTFGLTQAYEINQVPKDRKPLSATMALSTQFIKMTPLTTLYIWLDSEFESETMITSVTGDATKITLVGDSAPTFLKYDPTVGKFLHFNPSNDFLARKKVLASAAK